MSKTDSDLSPAPASPLLQGHWTLLHPNRQIARPLPHRKDEDEVWGQQRRWLWILLAKAGWGEVVAVTVRSGSIISLLKLWNLPICHAHFSVRSFHGLGHSFSVLSKEFCFPRILCQCLKVNTKLLQGQNERKLRPKGPKQGIARCCLSGSYFQNGTQNCSKSRN